MTSTPAIDRSPVPDRLAAAALTLAVISAFVGLFASGIYRDSDAWVRQARAADLVTLLAVGPILAAALWRARAGSNPGRLVVLAALGYLAYNYAIFGFSVTINPMTPVHIAVLGLSVWALVLGIVGIARTPLDPTTGAQVPRRTSAIFLVLVALLFGAMWIGQIAGAVSSGVLPAAIADLGLTTNPVYTLDLAFALPFLFVAGIALLRGSPIGRETAAAAVVWTALMGLGVLAIFVFDAAAGAEVEPAVAAIIGAITAIAVLLSVASLTPRLSRARINAGRMPV
jgi:hypothetical protein